jgi:hypothetical protein
MDHPWSDHWEAETIRTSLKEYSTTALSQGYEDKILGLGIICLRQLDPISMT